jgi:hypothetical protein
VQGEGSGGGSTGEATSSWKHRQNPARRNSETGHEQLESEENKDLSELERWIGWIWWKILGLEVEDLGRGKGLRCVARLTHEGVLGCV